MTDENLERVSNAIADYVVEFCSGRVGETFHMEDLTSYVKDKAPSAPDSAGRILRYLREKGRVAYELVSRPDSLYRVLQVS